MYSPEFASGLCESTYSTQSARGLKPQGKDAMKNMKRISKVTIKRMVDTDPDTSYLGEYSNDAETDYAIDRKHAEDCQSQEYNHRETVEQLERIISYLSAVTYSTNVADEVRETASEAQDVLIDSQNAAQECDCNGGDMNRNEYRYFNGNVENYKGETAENIRKYVRRDYERSERLNQGDWCYIGIQAEAEILLPVQANRGCVKGHEVHYSVTQAITSGGLWGIESDSSKEYFAETEADELASLREQLTGVGFSKRAIATAFKNALRENV